MKKYNSKIILLIIFILFFGIVSCKKQVEKKDTVDLIDISNVKTETIITLDELYLIPSGYDMTPSILEDLKSNKDVITTFKESSTLEIESELENYLISKKIYAKTVIFNEVP